MLSRWTVLTLLAAATTELALAQLPPKSGREWYEETSQHGFKVKPPKDWNFFPDERGNPNVLGRYLPKRDKGQELDDGSMYQPTMWLLVFDKEYKEPEVKNEREARRAAITSYHSDLHAWLKSTSVDHGVNFQIHKIEVLEEDEYRVKETLGARPVLYSAVGESLGHVYYWATHFKLSEQKEVVLLFNAPTGKRDWVKWRTQLKKIAKTFKRIELEELDTSAISGSGVRAQKHRKLIEVVEANPGWELYVTENYFVISNSDDRDFLKEIQARLEAIREQYEKEFPEEKATAAATAARERRAKALKEARAKAGDGGASTPPPEEGEGQETTIGKASPRELSRCSVVRVCANRDDYMRYGGPAGSAGYWWSATEELVIFDDQERGGRRNTWATLNHEAFHQFIFYFFANLSPGTWYNEGNADFYSGYKLNSRKKYDLGRFDWRNSTIKEEIREGKNVPLKTLVGATKNQYYAREPLENPETGASDTFSRYPHGWSFMYFLRTGKKNRAKNWDDSWDTILNTYLDSLIESGDTEAANEVAFKGVDWTALEESWQTYILKGK